jgi:hypothetical protein
MVAKTRWKSRYAFPFLACIRTDREDDPSKGAVRRIDTPLSARAHASAASQWQETHKTREAAKKGKSNGKGKAKGSDVDSMGTFARPTRGQC